MKKAQFPLMAELDLGATEDITPKSNGTFAGTANQRHLRVLTALRRRPCRREEVDRTGGVSNGPDLIADLRRLGLSVPCRLTPGIDRDGFPVRFGVYALTDDDQRKLAAWLHKRTRGVGGA